MTKKSTLGKNSLIRNPDVVLREEDPDGALLFNPDTNQIRVINSTGLFIWKHCDVEGQVKVFVYDMQSNGFLGIPETKVK
jgi:hypothetical protein